MCLHVTVYLLLVRALNGRTFLFISFSVQRRSPLPTILQRSAARMHPKIRGSICTTFMGTWAGAGRAISTSSNNARAYHRLAP